MVDKLQDRADALRTVQNHVFQHDFETAQAKSQAFNILKCINAEILAIQDDCKRITQSMETEQMFNSQHVCDAAGCDAVSTTRNDCANQTTMDLHSCPHCNGRHYCSEACRLADKGHVCTRSTIIQTAEHFVRSLLPHESELGLKYMPYSGVAMITVPPLLPLATADITIGTTPSLETLQAIAKTNGDIQRICENDNPHNMPDVPLNYIIGDDVNERWDEKNLPSENAQV